MATIQGLYVYPVKVGRRVLPASAALGARWAPATPPPCRHALRAAPCQSAPLPRSRPRALPPRPAQSCAGVSLQAAHVTPRGGQARARLPLHPPAAAAPRGASAAAPRSAAAA
jgi:hypothetical protein